MPYLPKGTSLIDGSKDISIYRPSSIENSEGLFKPMGDVIIKNDMVLNFNDLFWDPSIELRW